MLLLRNILLYKGFEPSRGISDQVRYEYAVWLKECSGRSSMDSGRGAMRPKMRKRNATQRIPPRRKRNNPHTCTYIW